MIKEEIKKYDEIIIAELSKLIRSLPLENINMEFMTFCYLLWNGYFSLNNNFEYSIETADCYSSDLEHYERLDVYAGKACCRNIAELLKKVFEKLGYDSHLINTYLSDFNKKDYKLAKVNKKNNQTKPSKFRMVLNDLKYVMDEKENHVIVAVLNPDNVMLYDPTNLCVSEVLNKKKTYGYGWTNNQKIPSLYNEILNSERKNPSFDTLDIMEVYQKAIEICEQNKELFDDFNRRIQPLLELCSIEVFEKIGFNQKVDNAFGRNPKH